MKSFLRSAAVVLSAVLLLAGLIGRISRSKWTEPMEAAKKMLVAQGADLDPFPKTQAEGHGSKEKAR